MWIYSIYYFSSVSHASYLGCHHNHCCSCQHFSSSAVLIVRSYVVTSTIRTHGTCVLYLPDCTAKVQKSLALDIQERFNITLKSCPICSFSIDYFILLLLVKVVLFKYLFGCGNSMSLLLTVPLNTYTELLIHPCAVENWKVNIG